MGGAPSCDCDYLERIAAGLEAAIRKARPETWQLYLAAFTRASALKENG